MGHTTKPTKMSPGNLKFLLDVDVNGTNLSKSEIEFIANLVDGKTEVFTDAMRLRLRDIHDRRVVNGEPEDD